MPSRIIVAVLVPMAGVCMSDYYISAFVILFRIIRGFMGGFV